MIESLLTTVFGEVKDKGLDKDSTKLGDALVSQLQVHIALLKKHDGERRILLDKERKEQAKHITSDDLKDGWDASVRYSLLVSAKTSPGAYTTSQSVAPKAPEPELAIKPKPKASTSTIEVLNPAVRGSASVLRMIVLMYHFPVGYI